MQRPNFFIIGGPKCGTTALYHYLKTHPNIFFPEWKEPHFFSKDIHMEMYDKTMDEYLELFKDADEQHKIVGEASVWYLFSEVAVKNIYEFNKDAKLIVMVRNPIEMSYSYFSQARYNDEEYIDDFQKAWELIPERMSGKYILKNNREPKRLNYHKIALLGEQIERLFQTFPKNQIMIIFFDDFKKDTKKVYDEVLSFLGLESDNRTEFPVINDNKEIKNNFYRKIFRAVRIDYKATNPINAALYKVFPHFKHAFDIEALGLTKYIYRKIGRQSKRKELSREFRIKLVEAFRQDIELLSKLTNRDLSHWYVQ